MKIATYAGIAAAMLICGCSTVSTEPERVNQDYGNSVRQMINNQVYDKNSPTVAPDAPNKGMDGVRGEAVLKKQRESVGNPSSVDEEIQIKASP